MKKAFTLIELMISIMILSILMLFLYKSYSDLNRSNRQYTSALESLNEKELLKKAIYLDLLMASKSHMIIQNIDREFDLISFKTKHSLHRRVEPYVCYIIKDKVLYRLESLLQITSIDINRDIAFDIDRVAKVKKFRIFGTRGKDKELYLLNMRLENNEQILLKVKVLN